MANQNVNPDTPAEATPRPLTRTERRSLWLNEYSNLDVALQVWARLVEEEDQEIEIMFQMHGLLVFGTMVRTSRYAQFYINLHEEMYRQSSPETADFLSEYYNALIPPTNQSEFGPEGLPILYRYAHLRGVTIISGGHKIKLPYWRGQLNQIEAFVIGASAGE